MSAKRVFNYLKKKYGITDITSKASGYVLTPKHPHFVWPDGKPVFIQKDSGIEIGIASGGYIELGFGTNYDVYCGCVFGWFEIPEEIKSASGFCVKYISISEYRPVPDSDIMAFDVLVNTDIGVHSISAFYAPTRKGGKIPLYMFANTRDGMVSLHVSPSSFVDLTAE